MDAKAKFAKVDGKPEGVWDEYLAPRIVPCVGTWVDLIDPSGRNTPARVLDNYCIGKFRNRNGLEYELVVPVFDMNMLYHLANLITYRRSKGFDTVILITGQERAGKSTLAQKLARLVMP